VKLLAGAPRDDRLRGPSRGLLGGPSPLRRRQCLAADRVAALKIGRTDCRGRLERTPNGVELALRGPAALLRVRHATRCDDAAIPGPPAAQSSTKMTLQLQQVLLSAARWAMPTGG
jgi:hypothetical protein